jgi:hypothetical protein
VELFKLFGSIMVDSDKADSSLSKIDGKAQGVASTLGKGIATAAKFGVALGAAAAAGGAALFGMATKAAESTDRIDKLSQKIGVSRKSFQEWDFILSQNGASIEGLQTGMKTLSKAADEAAQGTATYTDVFDRLNVSVTDNNGNLKDQEVLFNETILALSEMENETERTALASQLLGKSATELAPMLNGGAESVEALRAKAQELGLVLGDEAIDAGVKFTDTIDQAKRALGAIVTQIGVGVMPMFQSVFDWVLANMPQIKKVMGTVFDAIGAFVKTAGEIFVDYLLPIIKEIYEWIQDNWPEIQAIGEKVFGAIFKIIERVWGLFKNQLLPILKALYDFVAPTFPIIGKIIETAFNVVIGVINIAISAFEKVLGVINGIIGAIQTVKGVVSNAIDAVTKRATIEVNYDESGLQGLATGTPYVARGGRFMVGEAGPEEVFLPKGAAVIPTGVNGTNIFNIYGNNAEEVWALLYDKLIDAGVIA